MHKAIMASCTSRYGPFFRFNDIENTIPLGVRELWNVTTFNNNHVGLYGFQTFRTHLKGI